MTDDTTPTLFDRMEPPPPPRGVPADVTALFEKLTFDVISKGFKHYSARGILHAIRWHHHVSLGNRGFKCNNLWSAPLSRWMMKKHPTLDGFFETRERDVTRLLDRRS